MTPVLLIWINPVKQLNDFAGALVEFPGSAAQFASFWANWMESRSR